ncbi:MAG: hypothetical protein LLH30_04705 [Candidatus Manganitrophus sp. SA1]|nr:hypothetical protein [Candidatus Manganitrophus morganii]
MNSKRQVTRFRLLIALSTLFAVTGCGSQSSPPASLSESPSAPTGVTARIFVGNEDGTVSVIDHGDNGNTVSQTLPTGSGSIGDLVASEHNHIFVNATDNNLVAALDPIGETVTHKKNIAVGSRPVHAFVDPTDRNKIWVMNDGNATSGPCLTAAPDGGATSSVTVIQNHGEGGDDHGSTGSAGEVLATICVGRGHHKAAFSFPSDAVPTTPQKTFVSNISDGTVSVIDNNPASATYLQLLGTVDLCDPAKKAGGCDADLATSSSAVPHGIDFSPLTGKIYNANVGYGTVSVIDSTDNTHTVETAIDISFANKAHVSPDGQFLIVKGTDTASDPNHVIGKLTVIRLSDHLVTSINLPDVHPDSFEFTPDGNKLYVVSATTGSDAQKANLKNGVVLAFDSSALPALPTPTEIAVGVADADHRALAIHEHDGEAEIVIVPNPANDTVSIIDVATDTVVDTILVGDEPGAVLVFSFEGDLSH